MPHLHMGKAITILGNAARNDPGFEINTPHTQLRVKYEDGSIATVYQHDIADGDEPTPAPSIISPNPTPGVIAPNPGTQPKPAPVQIPPKPRKPKPARIAPKPKTAKARQHR